MEIALSLSGGGYRAAVYHIGVLSYLDSITDDDGHTLLDSVNILSSVSGGSLTSLWYVLHKSKGKPTKESLRKLFRLIVENDIEKELFEDFKEGAKEGNTLVMQLSKVYDKLFFHGEKYGSILSYILNSQNNIHHYAVCATDFNNGRPFHFYASRDIEVEGKTIEQFKIGHQGCSIDPFIAEKLNISDLLAASSCFPGVFEPFIYPDDFCIEDKQVVRALSNSSFSLMDGGVVDNQGIEAIVKLDHEYREAARVNIDMVIVSDVAKAIPQKYVQSKIEIFGNNDTVLDTITKKLPGFLNHYKCVIFLSLLIIVIFSVLAFIYESWIRSLSFVVIGALLSFLGIYIYIRLYLLQSLYNKVASWVKGTFTKGLTFNFDESFVLGLKTNSVLDFFNNRYKSLILMSSDVMMGQIRRYKLRQAFAGGNDSRTVLNAIYALTPRGTWTKPDKKLDRILRPNSILQNISNEVANIDTDLCFSEVQKSNDIPRKLVACGQYTTCWNLLITIKKIKALPEIQRSDTQKKLLTLEHSILSDWNHFNNNEPHYKSIV